MSSYGEMIATLEQTLPTLAPWRCQVLAALAAERLYPTLTRSGGAADGARAFLGEREVALALELAWAAALGEPASDAELRHARQAIADQLDERWHQLLDFEQQAFSALLEALEAAITPEDRRPTRRAITTTMSAADPYEAIADEIAYWRAALASVAELEERGLARAMIPAIPSPPSAWLRRAVAGRTPQDEGEDDDEDGGEDDGGEDDGGGWLALLVAADESRATWIASERQAHPVPPWREPTGIPARYRVIKAGKSASSRQGVVSVSGHDLVGLAEASSGALVFTPPSAVALGMAPDERELISWRVERRPDRSGVARGDYDWILERYAWPEQTLTSAHVVTSRKLVEWHWPGELAVPLWGHGRVLVLGIRSEDEFLRLYVVQGNGGEVRETIEQEEAEAWVAERG
jgi:hypothetical protein